MNFIKPKEQILAEVHDRVAITIRNTLQSSEIGGPHANALAYAMTAGIQEAVKVLIESTYTDQQFEEDMRLRE